MGRGRATLFAYFTRGTGQTLSGRCMPMFHLHLPMADKMYATDYYCAEGTDAIIDVWENNILDDGEIRRLMNRIGGAIFEDYIELSTSTIPWTNRFGGGNNVRHGVDGQRTLLLKSGWSHKASEISEHSTEVRL